jgi:hypothetical protein
MELWEHLGFFNYKCECIMNCVFGYTQTKQQVS